MRQNPPSAGEGPVGKLSWLICTPQLSDKLCHQCFKVILYLALPQDEDSPSGTFQLCLVLQVILHVFLELLKPEIPACTRGCTVLASFMAVPVAAMYKNDGLVLRPDNVRVFPHIFYILPVPKSLWKKIKPHLNFNLRVFFSYFLHISAFLFWG